MRTKHIFMYKTSKKQDVEDVDKIYVYSPFNEKKSQLSKCTIIEVAAYGVHHVCCKRQTICRRLEEMVITNFSRGERLSFTIFLNHIIMQPRASTFVHIQIERFKTR